MRLHSNCRYMMRIAYWRPALPISYWYCRLLRCWAHRWLAYRLALKCCNSGRSIVCVVYNFRCLAVILLRCYFEKLHSLWTLCLLVCLLSWGPRSLVALVLVDWAFRCHWSLWLFFFAIHSLRILEIVGSHKHWLLHIPFFCFYFLIYIV